MKIVDSHLHLDIIGDDDIFDYMRHNLRAVVIWSYCEPRPKTFADLNTYFERQQTFALRCTSRGLPCFRLAGIHPRNIPFGESLTQTKINRLLEPQLVNNIYGIGEIGLETGSAEEEDILAMQLDFAKRHGLKACVHTPRKNKGERMPATLKIVEQSGINRHDVVIDHLDSTPLVWTVVNMGYYAGVTISPAKSSLANVLEILGGCPQNLGQIMLNSDLALPRLDDYKFYVESLKKLPPEYAPLYAQNALNFFNIKL